MTRSRHFCRTGFTLIEMLVVLAIIGVIAAFALPAVSTMLRGSQLTQASEMLREEFALARQYALGKNRAIEVRLIRFGDPEQPGEEAGRAETGRFRAVQLMEVNPAGIPLPLGKLRVLPETVIMNDRQLSSLLDRSGAAPLELQKPGAQDPELPRGAAKNYDFVAFRFRPDGSTNLTPTLQWYLTLQAATDRQPSDDKPPANYFTLQLDPVSGSCRSYRPTAG